MSKTETETVTPVAPMPPVARVTDDRPATSARGLRARVAASGFSRIAGISASLLSTQALTSVLGLVFWTLAARQFLTSEVGVAGAAIALMMLLGSLGSLGLGTVLIARLPMTGEAERRVLVRTCLAASAAGGVLLGLVVPAAAVNLFHVTALAPIAGSIVPLLLFAAGTGLTSLVIVLDQAVLTIGIGALQFERNVASSVAKTVALAIFGVAGVHGGMVIFLAWAIGNLVSLPLVAWRTRGGRVLAAGRAMVEPRLLRGVGRLAVSHHALNVSIQAALQVLPVLVTVLVSAAANASFNAAIMLAGIVFALPYAVSIGLFAAARGDESEVLKRMRLTIPFGLAVSATASIVLFPLAGPLLHIFGDTYAADGTVILRLIVLAGLPFVVKDHFIALRRVQGRTTQALAVTSAFLVLELAGAFAGAQLGGVVGLCIGWLVVLGAEAVILAVPLVLAFRGGASSTRSASDVDEAGPDVATDPAPDAIAIAPLPAEPARTTAGTGSTWFDRNLTGPTLLVMSLGVLLMAGVANAGRAGQTGTLLDLGWIAGLVLVFAPAAVRIVAPSTPAVERVVVAIGLGMMLQFSRLVLNPTSFVFHDELIHADTLRQIDQSGHLFTFNPLLPVSAYYPGLEIVTDALQNLTGLPAFPAAAITLLLARLVMVLAIIGVIRIVTGSYRAGAVGVLVYIANPQLLFFNSQYSYQTLALPLALLAVYLFAARRRGSRFSLVLPLAVTTGVVLTHHLTAALLIAAFAVWLLLALISARRGRASADSIGAVGRLAATARRDRAGLAIVTGWGIIALGVSVANPGNPITGYLGAIVGSSSSGVAGLAEGKNTKALFSDSAGTGPAPWEQVLLIAAVLIAVASLLVVLGHLRTNWKAARPLAVLLGIVALMYPLVPAGHLTQATAEVGDRAAGFVFLGTAAVLGTWWWQRRRSRRIQLMFALGCTVLFLGDVVLGAGPTAGQLPGPYEISADARSIDAANLSAAGWENDALDPDSVVYADRTSGLLAAAIGGQDTVLHVSTGVDASRLLLAPTVNADDIALIRKIDLDYLIVDTRLSTGLPHQQVYIENGEYGQAGRTTPVSREALDKFDTVRGVERVYDNGSLVIYDVRGLK
jgi:O-antigen/teichoic acid export membrane protein